MASLSALSVMGERKSGQSIRQQNVMAAQVKGDWGLMIDPVGWSGRCIAWEIIDIFIDFRAAVRFGMLQKLNAVLVMARYDGGRHHVHLKLNIPKYRNIHLFC